MLLFSCPGTCSSQYSYEDYRTHLNQKKLCIENKLPYKLLRPQIHKRPIIKSFTQMRIRQLEMQNLLGNSTKQTGRVPHLFY